MEGGDCRWLGSVKDRGRLWRDFPWVANVVDKKGRCPRVLDSSSSPQLAIHMSIVSNAFKVPNRPSTISQYDHHNHDISRINGTAPYLSCKDILASVSAEHGNGDSLKDCYYSDALFCFAIDPILTVQLAEVV